MRNYFAIFCEEILKKIIFFLLKFFSSVTAVENNSILHLCEDFGVVCVLIKNDMWLIIHIIISKNTIITIINKIYHK